jgi:FKBP-type peptidyl-prolyl cis-trans isomerase 2
MLKTGDIVKVHYTGSYLDDTVFDTTVASEPVTFTIGDEMMIPAFEEAVKSMKVDEKKTIILKAADAYGEYDEELLIDVNRKEVFGDKEIKIGDIIQVPTDDGAMVFKVHKIDGEAVILDGNLEMAGKDVKFEIELISLIDANSVGLNEDMEAFEDIFDDELDDGIEFSDDVNIEDY